MNQLALKKKYGEFTCKLCGKVFFEKKRLAGHMGGAHRRNITKTEKPKCKCCNDKLIEGKNWPKWAVKQRNLICKKCKNIQNKNAYRRKLKEKRKVRK